MWLPLSLGYTDNFKQVLSIVESEDVEPVKACLIGNHVDLGNLAIHNREFENEYRLIQMTRDDAYRSVHEHRLHTSGTTGELIGLLGYGLRTANNQLDAARNASTSSLFR